MVRSRMFRISVSIIIGLIISAPFFAFYCMYSDSPYSQRTIHEYLEASPADLKTLIDRELESVDRAAGLVSSSYPVMLALANESRIAGADRVMDRYKQHLGLSVVYVMRLDGMTIASSNRNDSDSFVGNNYFFRPYFKEAMTGNNGHYFAVGVTSKVRGYYSSNPVYDDVGDVIGVAVVKQNIDHLKERYINKMIQKGYIFITDPNGIIFMSSNPDLVLKSLYPVDDVIMQDLKEKKQFSAVDPVPLITKSISDDVVQIEGKPYRWRQVGLDRGDFAVVVFHPMMPFGKRVLQFCMLLALLSSLAYFFMVSYGSFHKSRLDRLEKRKMENMQKKLENMVNKRTKELKRKTRQLEDKTEELKKINTRLKKSRVKELEGFYKIAVGRETKMIELKKELKQLKSK